MSVRSLLASAASVLVLGAGLVAAAPAANAATPTEYGCPTDYVCGYTEKNFTGDIYKLHYSQLEGHCGIPPRGVVFHSLLNMSNTERFYWWEYGHCAGPASGLLQYHGQQGDRYSDYLFSSVTHT